MWLYEVDIAVLRAKQMVNIYEAFVQHMTFLSILFSLEALKVG
jgi:hypothetical protein